MIQTLGRAMRSRADRPVQDSFVYTKTTSRRSHELAGIVVVSEIQSNGKVSWQAGQGVRLLTLINPPANGYSHEMMLDLDAQILAGQIRSRRTCHCDCWPR